ncbi:MAG: SURF1 family protein [Pseudomonadota bacterium]
MTSLFADRRFVFRPALSISTVLSLLILFSLGSWQLQRLEWKRGLIEAVETRVGLEPVNLSDALVRRAAGEDIEYLPVKISGVFQHDNEVLMFGQHERAAGVFVFTPLRVDPAAVNNSLIYVNRGFAPQSAANAAARVDAAVQEEVTVAGLFRAAETLHPPASWFRSTKQSGDGLWWVRDPTLFASAAGLEAPAFYVDSFGGESPGPFPEGGVTRLEFSNRHLEYAWTWFGLAGTLIAVWVAFSFPRFRH